MVQIIINGNLTPRILRTELSPFLETLANLQSIISDLKSESQHPVSIHEITDKKIKPQRTSVHVRIEDKQPKTEKWGKTHQTVQALKEMLYQRPSAEKWGLSNHEVEALAETFNGWKINQLNEPDSTTLRSNQVRNIFTHLKLNQILANDLYKNIEETLSNILTTKTLIDYEDTLKVEFNVLEEMIKEATKASNPPVHVTRKGERSLLTSKDEVDVVKDETKLSRTKPEGGH